MEIQVLYTSLQYSVYYIVSLIGSLNTEIQVP